MDEAALSMGAMMQWIREAIVDRRTNPRDDLVTKLVAARQEDGSPIANDSILSVLIQFIGGGQETTVKLLMNAMWMLVQRPDVERQLRADPSLIDDFIEEVLRHDSPVHSVFRVTRSDVEIGGVAIPAGSMVQLAIGAANRDPLFFPDADAFDLNRNGRTHMAFSQGPHFCPGSLLARLEGVVAFTHLLERFSTIELSPVQPLEDVPFYRSHLHRGVRELWIDYTL